MNRQLKQIRRSLEKGPARGYPPYDKYCYNAFAWQAQWFTTNGKTAEEREEGARLRDMANEKSRAMTTAGQSEVTV